MDFAVFQARLRRLKAEMQAQCQPLRHPSCAMSWDSSTQACHDEYLLLSWALFISQTCLPGSVSAWALSVTTAPSGFSIFNTPLLRAVPHLGLVYSPGWATGDQNCFLLNTRTTMRSPGQPWWMSVSSCLVRCQFLTRLPSRGQVSWPYRLPRHHSFPFLPLRVSWMCSMGPLTTVQLVMTYRRFSLASCLEMAPPRSHTPNLALASARSSTEEMISSESSEPVS